ETVDAARLRQIEQVVALAGNARDVAASAGDAEQKAIGNERHPNLRRRCLGPVNHTGYGPAKVSELALAGIWRAGHVNAPVRQSPGPSLAPLANTHQMLRGHSPPRSVMAWLPLSSRPSLPPAPSATWLPRPAYPSPRKAAPARPGPPPGIAGRAGWGPRRLPAAASSPHSPAQAAARPRHTLSGPTGRCRVGPSRRRIHGRRFVDSVPARNCWRAEVASPRSPDTRGGVPQPRRTSFPKSGCARSPRAR